jgi:hypothetical protein
MDFMSTLRKSNFALRVPKTFFRCTVQENLSSRIISQGIQESHRAIKNRTHGIQNAVAKDSKETAQFYPLCFEKKIKQATRKRLGMHVLLIEVEERNSEGKILSILGKDRKSTGRNSKPFEEMDKELS